MTDEQRARELAKWLNATPEDRDDILAALRAVRADEREACAVFVEKWATGGSLGQIITSRAVVAAIRARTPTPAEKE